MKPIISIIDYKMGNLFSVQCALNYVGIKSIITDDAELIKKTDGIILPGVGAFSEAMKRIKQKKLENIIKEFNDKKKTILGICLGMQLLFEKSFENNETQGLSLLSGEVIKFNQQKDKNSFNVGWREISINKNLKHESTLLSEKKNTSMYFIHSYFVSPKNENIVSSKSEFEKEIFTSSIKSDNILGFQFHPEKSATEGIEIYKRLKKNLEKSKNENLL